VLNKLARGDFCDFEDWAAAAVIVALWILLLALVVAVAIRAFGR
jgi:hypothetical protein